MKYRKSIQREKILDLLHGTKSHPTAGWIYDELKKELPSLSLGTVYRNLSILVKQNQIREINFGSNFDRYDAITEKHYHFICESCGDIYDIDLPVLNDLNNRVENLMHCKTNRHKIEFYGICENCMKK